MSVLQPSIRISPELTAGAPEGRKVVSNAVLAMIIFVVAEVMFFAALISAFTIAKAGALGGWPPPGQARLPLEATAVNTFALLLSGLFLFRARRQYRIAPERARSSVLIALILGAFFVVFQGIEWVSLIGQGLTITTSTHGAFFYLIVGTHALHAIAAILGLGYVCRRLWRDDLVPAQFNAASVFWYFVVGVWPALYLIVYL